MPRTARRLILLTALALAIPASPAAAQQCAYVCSANGDGGYTCWRVCG